MAKELEKIRFMQSTDGKDVVIKLSEYGSKLTSDGRVMKEIPAKEEGETKYPVIIKHGMMNSWDISIPSHESMNLRYIDWIACETNYGIHIIQVGPKGAKTEEEKAKANTARFSLSKGEKIVNAYAYSNHAGLIKTPYVSSEDKKKQK